MPARRQQFIERRKAAGYTQETFAEALHVDRVTVGRWERGDTDPQPYIWPKLAKLLRVSTTELITMLGSTDVVLPTTIALSSVTETDDEEQALELARRVDASDVGTETIARLEDLKDELSVAYTYVAPHNLIPRVRQAVGYVNKLLDSHMTLDEHRRLLVVGGWLSLLAATLHIDLKQYDASTARLKTASSLARHAGHDEIRAWCYETTAWRALTDGDYEQALELAQVAQTIAPAGSSALVQATAQEGRASARLKHGKETYDAMSRVSALVASREKPELPGHHFQYDPDKFTTYSATTLAWLGDPAAEDFAREIIARLGGTEADGKWPRRLASARIDLALSLVVTDRLDEASATVLSAFSSGNLPPSNYWRALEVVTAVEAKGLAEAKDLREAYEGLTASESG